MADTGFVLVGQGRSVDRSQQDWTSPDNITADDGSSATNASLAADGDTTDWLVGDSTALDALLPANAIIEGIEFKVQASSSLSTCGIDTVNIGKDDSTLGTAQTLDVPITTSMVDYFFGGAKELWDLAISRAEVIASDFQVRLFFRNDDKSTAATISVDAIWIKVYYRKPNTKVIFLKTSGDWTVPEDWNSRENTIEALGGGGGGGTGNSDGGGGGGAYSRKNNAALTPGDILPYTIGAAGLAGSAGGDTWFGAVNFGSSIVGARGGAAGTTTTGGVGGDQASGVGDVKTSGGQGGTGQTAGENPGGGGGGGAAGPDGNGGNGGAGETGTTGKGGGGGAANGGGNGESAVLNPNADGGRARNGTPGGVVSSAGSKGSGGGGTNGAGSQEHIWTQTSNSEAAGPGSGCGGSTTNVGSGSYGAGGGGRGVGSTSGRAGTQGIIIITYTTNKLNADVEIIA